ncbi:unnamed protein product, partial [Ixodes pacificus]
QLRRRHKHKVPSKSRCSETTRVAFRTSKPAHYPRTDPRTTPIIPGNSKSKAREKKDHVDQNSRAVHIHFTPILAQHVKATQTKTPTTRDILPPWNRLQLRPVCVSNAYSPRAEMRSRPALPRRC